MGVKFEYLDFSYGDSSLDTTIVPTDEDIVIDTCSGEEAKEFRRYLENNIQCYPVTINIGAKYNGHVLCFMEKIPYPALLTPYAQLLFDHFMGSITTRVFVYQAPQFNDQKDLFVEVAELIDDCIIFHVLRDKCANDNYLYLVNIEGKYYHAPLSREELAESIRELFIDKGMAPPNEA